MPTTALHRKLGDQFFDNSGNLLVGGRLSYYNAGTSSLQDTYQNAGGTIFNTNPINLDGAGRLTTPVYLGAGADYKELLTTSGGATVNPWPFDNIPKAVDPNLGNTGFFPPYINWVFVTQANSPVSIAATDAGKGWECDTTGGAVVFTLPSASTVGSGKPFCFKRTAGSNPVVLNGSALNTIDGGASMTLGIAGQSVTLYSDGIAWQSVASSNAFLIIPQGRLTLISGYPVIAEFSGNTVYYTPYEGNIVPIWNGSSFVSAAFNADLPLSLSSLAIYSLVDIFAFLTGGGTLNLGYGPGWPSYAARGTGAGTTEIRRQNGLWVNANAITLTNGGGTANIAVAQATYLGTCRAGTANSTSIQTRYGQNRNVNLWNAYNRVPVRLLLGDTTASWTYNSTTWRPSNNNAANLATLVCGLPEEAVDIRFVQQATSGVGQNQSMTSKIAIGIDSGNVPSGKIGANSDNWPNQSGYQNLTNDLVAEHVVEQRIGAFNINLLESTTSTTTYLGTQGNMQCVIGYRA